MAGEATKDVRVVARVEREGDPDAIRQVADDIESLAPAADEASGALGALEDVDLESLGADAEQAAKGVRELADVPLDETKKQISGVGDQLAKLPAKATPAKKSLSGISGALDPKKPSEAARRIADAVSALTKKTDDAAGSAGRAADAYEALGGSPTEFIGRANTALERAVILTADLQKQVDQLDEESREGLSGFADRSAKAKQRMEELRAVVDDLGDDELPEVRQELRRLERQFVDTFETGARRAAKLEAEIENTEDQLKRMKLEARKGGEGITDLGDAFQLQFPRASKAVAGAVGSVVAFKEAFTATREAIGFLKEQFGIDVDAMVQDSLRLVGVGKVLESIGEQGELLRNQKNIFDKAGIEGFSADTEKNAEIIAANFLKIRLAANETADFLSKLSLNPEELTKQAEELAKNIKNALESAGENLDLKTFRERVKGEIQKLLDDLIAAGAKIPESFQEIADKLSILPSALEKVAADVTETTAAFTSELRALLLEIPGFVDETSDSIRKKEKVLKAALEQVFGGIQGVNLLKPEQKDALKKQIQELVKEAEQIGVKLDPVIQAHAGYLGVLIGRYNQTAISVEEALSQMSGAATSSADTVGQAAKAQGEALSEVKVSVNDAGEAFFTNAEKVEEATSRMTDAARSSAQEVDQAVTAQADSFSEVTVTVNEAGEAFFTNAEKVEEATSRISDAVRTSADEVDQAALAQQDSIKIVTTSIDEAGEKFIHHETVTKEMALAMTLDEIKEAEPKLKAYAEALNKAQQDLINTGGAADEAATEMKKPADQASEAGTKVGELATASEGLAKATKDAGAGLEAQASGMERVKTAAAATGDTLTKIPEQLRRIDETEFGEGYIERMGAMITKTNELYEALQKLDNAGRSGEAGGSDTQDGAAPVEGEAVA